jgi:hypothetical protein
MLTCEHGVRPKKNCKQCNKYRTYDRKRTWERKESSKAAAKAAATKYYYAMWQSNPIKMRFQSIMIGLRRRRHCDVHINVLLDLWEKQNARCAYCGKEMTYERGGRQPASVSVDRIDPSVHYTETNIVLACWACNAGKGDMTAEKYIQHCQQVVRHNA